MAIRNAKLCRGQDERLLIVAVVVDAVECEILVVHSRGYSWSHCHSTKNFVPYLNLISGNIS